jgi:hypothetical protein
MKTVWTKGLNAEQIVQLKQDFVGGALLRERLSKLLEEKQDSSVKKSRSEDGYEKPNWAYQQADARGYERALSEVISLLLN